MELSPKEEYRNQKVSIGVTLFSFVVMLLFFVYTNVITAGSSPLSTSTQEIEFGMEEGNSASDAGKKNLASVTPNEKTASGKKEISDPMGEILPLTAAQQETTEQQIRAENTSSTIAMATDEGRIEGLKGDSKFGFELGNRKMIAFPHFTSDTKEEGSVVVDVVVDKNGEVIEADPNGRGSTTSSTDLKNKARKMAMATKFNPNQKIEEQRGTITINFSFN